MRPTAPATPGAHFTHDLGHKRYEIANHLGNVLATVSDRRLAVDANSDKDADGYLADIYSLSDYYPFGMEMRRRTASLYVNTATQQAELLLTETAAAGGTLYVAMDRYRYGFNGKEKDDEWQGQGNSYDFGARIYDPRLGRFLSVDPLMAQFPSKSPYDYAANNPILLIDRYGEAPALPELYDKKNFIRVVKSVDITYYNTLQNASNASPSMLQAWAWGAGNGRGYYRTLVGIAGEAVAYKSVKRSLLGGTVNIGIRSRNPIGLAKGVSAVANTSIIHAPDMRTDILIQMQLPCSEGKPEKRYFERFDRIRRSPGFTEGLLLRAGGNPALIAEDGIWRLEGFAHSRDFVIEVKTYASTTNYIGRVLGAIEQMQANPRLGVETDAVPILVLDRETFQNVVDEMSDEDLKKFQNSSGVKWLESRRGGIQLQSGLNKDAQQLLMDNYDAIRSDTQRPPPGYYDRE